MIKRKNKSRLRSQKVRNLLFKVNFIPKNFIKDKMANIAKIAIKKKLLPFLKNSSTFRKCLRQLLFCRKKSTRIFIKLRSKQTKFSALNSTRSKQSKEKARGDPIFFLSSLRSSNWIYTWNKLLICGDVFAIEELLWQVETWLGPLDVKIQRESDAVVLVIYLQHVRDLDSWNSKATNVKFLKTSASSSNPIEE